MIDSYLFRRHRWRHTLARLGFLMKPDFMIIGAQKAGTTSLFRCLASHPQVKPPICKEPAFFNDAVIPYGDFKLYQSHFPSKLYQLLGKKTFEATPDYLSHKLAPQRIYAFHPAVKLIAVLRNPIDRAFSAWSMYSRFIEHQDTFYRFRGTKLSFETCIEQELEHANYTGSPPSQGLLYKGLYCDQLKRFSRFFSFDEQIKVVLFDELSRDPDTLKEIQHFLGLKPHLLTLPVLNTNDRKLKMPLTLRKKLEDYYRPHNENLEEFLGRHLSW